MLFLDGLGHDRHHLLLFTTGVQGYEDKERRAHHLHAPCSPGLGLHRHTDLHRCVERVVYLTNQRDDITKGLEASDILSVGFCGCVGCAHVGDTRKRL